jgi:hypothetical protein
VATIPNPPTNYHELDESVITLKSGLTPWHRELLVTLKRLAKALERKNA